MRAAPYLIVVVVACAQPAWHPLVPNEPVATCVLGQASTDHSPSVLAEPRAIGAGERSAEIRRELADIDRSLDALDAEIAASAVAVAARPEQAVAQTFEESQIVAHTTLDMLPVDAPIQLRRLVVAYHTVQAKRRVLEAELGPKNVEMVANAEMLDWLRAAFDRQKEVELAEVRALRDAFVKLPPTASIGDIRKARLRVQLEIFITSAHTGIEPSDAPAAIRVPIDRAFDAQRRIKAESHALGPKHPMMVQLTAERDLALAEVDGAVDDTAHAMVAVLAAPPTKPPPFDATKLARRVDLAIRARELRDELAALEPH